MAEMAFRQALPPPSGLTGPTRTLDLPMHLSDKGKIMKKPVALLSLFFTLLPALVWGNSSIKTGSTVQITITGHRVSGTVPLASVGGVDLRPSSNGYTDYSIVSNPNPVGPLATYIYSGANPDEYSPATANDALATLERIDADNVRIRHCEPHDDFVESAIALKAGASVTFTIQYIGPISTNANVQIGPPVPFSGKVAIDGVNFHGQAQFTFAIRDHAGAVHWRNGATANDAINVSVFNGRYVVPLGGQGMNPLPASLFANHEELYIKVSFDKGDGQGWVHLGPDQRITAVPYALSAKIADMVKPGAITSSQIADNSITPAQLNEQVLKYLKPVITQDASLSMGVFPGDSVTLTAAIEGRFLTYQWKRSGQAIVGATEPTLVISDFNSSLHDGIYTLTASNDFGSVTSQQKTLTGDAPLTPLIWDLNATINLEMIWVPAGSFTMGSPVTEPGRSTNETEHNVTLTKGFYLGKYEVTLPQYEAVTLMHHAPQTLRGNEIPVNTLTWYDAKEFCYQLTLAEQNAGRLSKNWAFDLPTEAEWEYACRAGTSTAYSWGNTFSPSNAGYDLNQTANVGQYAPNPWGFYDMHGNVIEMTNDKYQDRYPSWTVSDPKGAEWSYSRVARGGNWYKDGTDPSKLRSARREELGTEVASYVLGFRIALKRID
jgi:formylglycine-generating enzyme required for sulfatase activity